jgi:REP element-mobilizing transposase RayT
MPVRFRHDQQDNSIYFVTFTCFKWKWLFDLSDAWNSAYKWFDALFDKGTRVIGYVVMPNHIHSLLYFPQMPKSLNTMIGNAKRFMAYDIIAGLEKRKQVSLLKELQAYVKKNEKKKGQRHKVFEDSLDAKECRSREFIKQKLDYIHKNPVSKRWQLVNDYTEYPYSSASFYEKGINRYAKLLHVAEVW